MFVVLFLLSLNSPLGQLARTEERPLSNMQTPSPPTVPSNIWMAANSTVQSSKSNSLTSLSVLALVLAPHFPTATKTHVLAVHHHHTSLPAVASKTVVEPRVHTLVLFLVPIVPCPCLGRPGSFRDPEAVQGRLQQDVVAVETLVVGEEKTPIKADVVPGEDEVRRLVTAVLGRVPLLFVVVQEAAILLAADRQVTLAADMEVPIGTTIAETEAGMTALPTEEEEVVVGVVHAGDQCRVRTPRALGLGL